jgi:hypothetical protein
MLPSFDQPLTRIVYAVNTSFQLLEAADQQAKRHLKPHVEEHQAAINHQWKN